MWRGLGLGAVAIACATAVVGWNVARFIDAHPKIREKQLDFLPAPVVAELLCLGHRNSVAKLRWIDSFAYFELLIDRKDDRVEGGAAGGAKRLYDTLIALDPHFEPFYEHAALTTSGILGRHGEALGFLQAGTLAEPQRSELWRNAATQLKVFFHWQDNLPLAFDAFLASWEGAESSADGKRMVWDWKRQMGRRQFLDLEQLPYWLDQLKRAKPGTPSCDYIEATIREQLARFGVQELDALADIYRVAHGGTARTITGLWAGLSVIDPLAAPAADPQPRSLDALLAPRLVMARYPRGLPTYGPLALMAGRLTVRSDPFGLPWRLDDGRALSEGLERRDFDKLLASANYQLLEAARAQGHWPGSLADARAMGVPIPDPGRLGRIDLDGEALKVTWTTRAEPPWPLR